MSFKINEYQQITLNDSFINLSPRTQKIIMNSWCKDLLILCSRQSTKNASLFFIAATMLRGQILRSISSLEVLC